MDGTYIREPNGANLLRWSPLIYNDAAIALRTHPRDFIVLHRGSDDWDMDAEREAQYLAPGEYIIFDGGLTIVGG
ncbi:MAG: hypothetical protein ACREA9_02565 [Pyrinomonadaceae bacterium]